MDVKEAIRRSRAFLDTVYRAHVNLKHQNCIAYLLQALTRLTLLQFHKQKL